MYHKAGYAIGHLTQYEVQVKPTDFIGRAIAVQDAIARARDLEGLRDVLAHVYELSDNKALAHGFCACFGVDPLELPAALGKLLVFHALTGGFPGRPPAPVLRQQHRDNHAHDHDRTRPRAAAGPGAPRRRRQSTGGGNHLA